MKGTIVKTIAAILVLCAAPAFAQSVSQTSTGNDSPNIVGSKNVTLHQKQRKAVPQAPAATPAPAPTPEPAKPAAAPPPDTVTPKESVDSLKLQLALEKQKSVQDQAQALQQQAMQAIEPRMVPLRNEYQKQLAAAKAAEDVVRKENGWGPDINLDSTLGSPNFGLWIKGKTPAK